MGISSLNGMLRSLCEMQEDSTAGKQHSRKTAQEAGMFKAVKYVV